MDSLIEHGGSEQGSTALLVLQKVQLLYPVTLLLAFTFSAGVHTVVTSKSEEQLAAPAVTGPGGKPLPITKRKREQEALEEADDIDGAGSFARPVFLYLTAAIVVSFVANGAAVAIHAMGSTRKGGITNAWWCGEERIVSFWQDLLWLTTTTLANSWDRGRLPSVMRISKEKLLLPPPQRRLTKST